MALNYEQIPQGIVSNKKKKQHAIQTNFTTIFAIICHGTAFNNERKIHMVL